MTSIVNEKIKYEIISYLCSYIHIFHDIHEHEIELAFFTNNLQSLKIIGFSTLGPRIKIKIKKQKKIIFFFI